jgi:hypothetical protein
MFVRFIAPAVEFGVRELLRDYRSPWAAGASDEGRHGGWTVQRAREAAGREGRAYVPGAEPIGWAGFEVRNSELGYGRTTITPRAEIEACGNGLKIVADLLGRTHLGARMDEGVVEWSEETQRIQLKLITSQAADAVRSFLDPTYWNRQVAELAVKADRPVADPTDGKVIATVAKELGFSEAQRKTVFDHFLRGGQFTAGGVMNAITSAAQVQADGDTAAEMEGTALRALELV